MTFTEWLEKVDRFCLRLFGCSYQDLPDYMFRDAFDDGATPIQVVQELQAENF